MQKELCFRPNSVVSGQVGQIQAFCSEMHMKLFPTRQKTCSFAFLAQAVCVGHFGQLHMLLYFSISLSSCAGDVPFTSFIICSNLSIVFTSSFTFNENFPIVHTSTILLRTEIVSFCSLKESNSDCHYTHGTAHQGIIQWVFFLTRAGDCSGGFIKCFP